MLNRFGRLFLMNNQSAKLVPPDRRRSFFSSFIGGT
jgi:hypothetical protein